ncbi:MAG: winged helix-turn-helix transcriptional regulator [Kiritimatiellae bacterium]|nr:winged helix-turn-helix transcriptional regulator [Kiritimatiellia bacterium]
MKSGNGEFRITFSDRTKESIAKLGIPPEKFGIVADVAEVAKNPEEVAKKVAKNLEEVAKKVAKRVSAAELRIIECIVEAPSISQAAIAERLGMTRQYIGRCMDDLQKRQIIRRVGPKKGGHWEMIFTESLNEKNNV